MKSRLQRLEQKRENLDRKQEQGVSPDLVSMPSGTPGTPEVYGTLGQDVKRSQCGEPTPYPWEISNTQLD